MEERGFIAQTLFERLHESGHAFAVLGDPHVYPERAPEEILLAVQAERVEGLPRELVRFAQDFDLHLVELERPAPQRWRATLAWGDAQGRQRFLALRIEGDYYVGVRRLLAAREQLAGDSASRFVRDLLHGIERGEPAEAWLAQLWAADPRSAIEAIARYWRTAADIRLIAQAAKHGEWEPVRTALPRLRRAMLQAVRPNPAAFLEYSWRTIARARVAFTGRESVARTNVMAQVARDLSPLKLVLFEDRPGAAQRADFRLVFDAPAAIARDVVNVAAIPRSLAVEAMAGAAERAILAWLECRVERRFPRATVGENPWPSRLVQAFRPLAALFGSAIRSPVRSPILMPYPFGIVIEDGARIGRRVTLMQQVMIGRGAVVEDNVVVGAGAKVLGPARVGRGAVIQPNAVISSDVPSHTVAGERRTASRALS